MQTVEKICEYCENNFTSEKKQNLRFCSRLCCDEYKKKSNREKRICCECGNEFIEKISRKRMFCSDECRRKWQTKPENVEKRMNRIKESVREKYGVDNTFQVKSIRLHANEEARKTYKIRGIEITKPALEKIENNKRNKLIERFENLNYKILNFCGDEVTVQHPDGHIFTENRKLVVNRLNHNVELSTIIQPIGSPRTTFERRICKLLDDHNVRYVSNDRKCIGLELDIYIPDYKLAIEIDGLHWHCEYYINDDYHLNKTKKCESVGVRLLHFFEDELLEKYEIVKSTILSELNLQPNIIGAEDCQIKNVNSRDSIEFLLNNHIQGKINSSIRCGLYYNGELVSLMVFSKIRNILGNRSNKLEEYEMLRYCDKINTKVIGGTLKQYEIFKKDNPTSIVIGFANKRYSSGELYKELNFTVCETIKPDYWYVVGKTRKHKFLYRKNILVDAGYDLNKTEHEIMTERKLPRIYDCGKIKFIDSY